MELPDPRAHAPESPRRPDRDRSFRFPGGEVTSTSFRIFARHLPVLVGLAALFHALPTYLNIQRAAAAKDVALGPGGHFWFEGPYGIAAELASWVLPLAFQAVVTPAVFRTLLGVPPNYAESVRQGFRRLHLALGSSFVVSIALFLPLVLPFLLFGTESEVPIVLMLVVGIVNLIVMGCAWFVSVQAAVVEGANPFKSMSRSFVLTRGARVGIFGVMLVVYLLPALLHGFVEQVAFAPVDPLVDTTSQVLLEAGFNVFFAGLQAVATVVIYHALRKGKEGVGLDELLAVFD